jgi:hypothetical protein
MDTKPEADRQTLTRLRELSGIQSKGEERFVLPTLWVRIVHGSGV